MLHSCISPSGTFDMQLISEFFSIPFMLSFIQSFMHSTCLPLRGRHCLQVSLCQFILTASQLLPLTPMWNLWTPTVSNVIPQPGTKTPRTEVFIPSKT